MSELTKRILTAILAGALVVFLIIWSLYGMYIFCIVVSLVGLYEFFQVTKLLKKRVTYVALGFGLVVWSFFIFYFIPLDSAQRSFVEFIELNWVVVTIAVLGLISMGALFDKKEENAVRTMGLMFGGFFYAFMPMVIYFMLGVSPWARSDVGSILPVESYEWQYPLGLMFLHWVLDTFAYFGGRTFGKKPLFPRISPKKTWAGALIGTAFCLGMGVILNIYFTDVVWNWIIVAAIVSPISQLGDLLESMYKRSLDIKDSGAILPGHGGMLDRFDGMYLTVPVVYLYLFGLYALAY